eukprot:gene153-biopygen311
MVSIPLPGADGARTFRATPWGAVDAKATTASVQLHMLVFSYFDGFPLEICRVLYGTHPMGITGVPAYAAYRRLTNDWVHRY